MSKGSEFINRWMETVNRGDVEVSVEAGSDLVLRISDDGTGIRPGGRRSGLANMAERAERLGGTLRTGPTDKSAGTGAELEWRVPLPQPDAADGVSQSQGAAVYASGPPAASASLPART